MSESQFSQVLNVELNQIIKVMLYHLFSLDFFFFVNLFNRNFAMQAYQYMDQGPIPKFTVIIAQKNHHTKLFQENTPDNVPPGAVLSCFNTSDLRAIYLPPIGFDEALSLRTGTVVDSGIVHPRQYDFYMYAHAGPIVSLLEPIFWK